MAWRRSCKIGGEPRNGDKNECLRLVDGWPLKTSPEGVTVGYVWFNINLHHMRTIKHFLAVQALTPYRFVHSPPICLSPSILQNNYPRDIQCGRWRSYWTYMYKRPNSLAILKCVSPVVNVTSLIQLYDKSDFENTLKYVVYNYALWFPK